MENNIKRTRSRNQNEENIRFNWNQTANWKLTGCSIRQASKKEDGVLALWGIRAPARQAISSRQSSRITVFGAVRIFFIFPAKARSAVFSPFPKQRRTVNQPQSQKYYAAENQEYSNFPRCSRSAWWLS